MLIANSRLAYLVKTPSTKVIPPRNSTKATTHANNAASGIPALPKKAVVPAIPPNSFCEPCTMKTAPKASLNNRGAQSLYLPKLFKFTFKPPIFGIFYLESLFK